MSRRMRLYVAGKYSADNVLDVLKNIGTGQAVCGLLFSMGYAPFCPWHDRTYVMDNPAGKFSVQDFRDLSMAWLEAADAVYVIQSPGVENSGGVQAEVDRAEQLGIPVFTDAELLELFRLEWEDKQK